MNEKMNNRNGIKKTVKIILISIGSIIGLLILGIIGITLWLTPERLAKIVNEESGKYIDADVHISAIDYKIWSTFPYLNVEIDSLAIRSKSLDKLANCSDYLPEGYNKLINSSRIKGSINLIKLISKSINFKDIEINDLNLNLVQVNDSVSNYNILSPEQLEKLQQFKIKGFSASSFKMSGKNEVDYKNLSKDIMLGMSLDSVIMLNEKKDSRYALDLSGNLSMNVKKDSLLNNIPIDLKGNIILPSDLKYAGIENFNIEADKIKCNIDFLADLESKLQVKKFDYTLNPVDIFSFLTYIPEQYSHYLDGLSGSLLLKSNGRLIKPYNPSTDTIPVFMGDISFFDGNIRYNNYEINDFKGKVELKINGKDRDNSTIEVRDMSLKGEGITMNLVARIKSLLAETPFVDINLNMQGDLDKLGKKIPYLKRMMLKGSSKINSDISFGLRYANGISLKDLVCDATVSLNDLNVKPAKEMNAGVKNMDISISGKINELNNKDFNINKITAEINSSGISFNTTDMALNGNTMKLSGVYTSSGNINANIGNITLDDKKDKVKVNAGAINLSGSLTKSNASGRVRIGEVKIDNPSVNVNLKDILLNGSLLLKSIMQRGKVLANSNSDVQKSTINSSIRHTPEYINFKLEKNVLPYIENTKGIFDAKIKSGNIITRAFPVDNVFSNIEITSDLSSLKVNNINFKSGGCAINLSGGIENLRDFIISEGDKTLKSNFNLSIDTLDLPRIARIYENGVANISGVEATLPAPKPPVSASDSVALMIPRNLDISVNASANHLLYTDLDLSDLSTVLSVKDGKARIGNLEVHAPFGRAVADVVYSTSDIEDMYLDFTADMQDFELVDFFDCYKNTLIKAMPYLSNLSGDLSAKAKGRISLFPTMYFDVPSMTASLDFQSHKLSVHQNKFIRRITRLMLIHTSDDIVIPNMNIKATVHDNLVELDPFDFIFNRYTLNLSGITNLNGEMFYHIAILKSPVPFPFAFNIKGTFAHPKLRFGGARLKTDDTEKVAADVREIKPLEINMVQNLKYGFIEFLKTAAAEDTTGNAGYIFPVLVKGK